MGQPCPETVLIFRFIAVFKPHRVVSCSYQRHGIFCGVRKLSVGGDCDPLYISCVDPAYHFLGGFCAVYLNIYIFTVAGKSYSQRSSKGHNLMRAEALAVADIYISPAHYLLEIPHNIQVADKFDSALLSEFNSYFHSRRLLYILMRRRQNISDGS